MDCIMFSDGDYFSLVDYWQGSLIVPRKVWGVHLKSLFEVFQLRTASHSFCLGISYVLGLIVFVLFA